jgi:transcriptional regulator with XRE-family HTH domain
MAELLPLPRRSPVPPEPLWREALGDVLRRLRHERGERLADTARRAGVSPQYLSEVERGLKEPSSEMIAAIAGALGVTLIDLTIAVASDLDGAITLTALAPASVAAPAPAGPGVYALAS